jgi:hypothetical protein
LDSTRVPGVQLICSVHSIYCDSGHVARRTLDGISRTSSASGSTRVSAACRVAARPIASEAASGETQRAGVVESLIKLITFAVELKGYILLNLARRADGMVVKTLNRHLGP